MSAIDPEGGIQVLFPEVVKMRQRLYDVRIDDVGSETFKQLEMSGINIKEGARIAIAAGSRGIANIHLIIRAVSDFVKNRGAFPFIVPAMGSHGGATADGQRKVLESYGITEEYVKAPIKSSMEVVELPGDGIENKVYMDRFAFESDGTIVVNRVKVHTDFHSRFESGLMKMLVIGLGKHEQAKEIHKYGEYGLMNFIPTTARQVIKYGKILGGVGILENGYEETAIIRAANIANYESTDLELLEINRRTLPRIPVDQLDVLVIDEIGKNISGVAMDTNVIGRTMNKFGEMPEKPRITNIVAITLSELSHGNANGFGIADVITRKLLDKVNFKATYENSMTSQNIIGSKTPLTAETDRQAVEYALRTCGSVEPQNARLIRIENTLKLSVFYASKPVCDELGGKPGIEILGGYGSLCEGENLRGGAFR